MNRVKKYTASNEEEAIQFLQNLSESSDKQTVIITPIFYSFLRKTSSDEKIINYIILNGFYDDPADNVIAVYSSREEVYYQAGIKAALFSKDNENCTVASVFYTGSILKRLEMESFANGYSSVEGSGELINFEQQTYTGGDNLKKFINSAPEKGTGLFFFSASSLNPFCIEQAMPLMIPISGENLNSLGIYNELVEFSVDDDMIEIIQTAIKIGLDGEIISDIPVKPLIRERGI
ncbi:MAG: BMP family ABC transporter substrate-binding protein, partial [Spirochaetaceae bacterium]|nr:BMP family ABC transporter substrate-binding protein [Spirochaetaceae bacterium]